MQVTLITPLVVGDKEGQVVAVCASSNLAFLTLNYFLDMPFLVFIWVSCVHFENTMLYILHMLMITFSISSFVCVELN